MNAVLTLVRRAAQLPGLQRLTRVDAVTRLTFALRGALVQEPVRFALNELRARPRATYRLRGSEIRVVIRHRTPDVLVLDEIFSQREYEFPPRVIDALTPVASTLRVADVGANIGLFGAFVLTQFPEASILAVEADPANAAVHAEIIRANGRGEAWQLVKAYAASRARDVRFAAGEYATSRGARNGEAGGALRAVDVFPLIGDAALVKIDIEGAEWELLADPRFSELSARGIVLEYHADFCPDEHPRAAAQTFLRRAGFEVVETGRKPRFGAGLLWGWRVPTR